MHADISRPSSPRRNQGLIQWLLKAFEVSRQRRHLSQLDAAALCDLGLTRADVQHELSQPFWMRPDFGRVSQPRQSDAARMAQYHRQ